MASLSDILNSAGGVVNAVEQGIGDVSRALSGGGSAPGGAGAGSPPASSSPAWLWPAVLIAAALGIGGLLFAAVKH